MLKKLCAALCGVVFPLSWAVAQNTSTDTDALLNHRLKRLHAPEIVDLKRYAGQPLLIVNTASFCAFTGQFKGLEALHQRYKDQGLVVLGFPSDDFYQEADSEAKSAEVCFINYGVSFDMFAPVPVRGADAHPVFAELTRQSGTAPGWNFYKYVVDREGRVTGVFSSRVRPDSAELTQAVESVLVP